MGDTRALPEHFFISYSREDQAYVARLRRRFEKDGIPVWIDTRDVVPGSSSWEKSIRNALDVSFAVVLVASPRAAASQFVQTELALATNKGLMVIPIWVEGDNWLDCVPLSAAHIQHIDLRATKFIGGTKALVRHLLRVIAERKPRHYLVPTPDNDPDRPRGLKQYVSIYVDEFDYFKPRENRRGDPPLAAFDPGAYANLQNLLGELHGRYLADKFPPLTYGERWVLQDRTNRGQFVAPKRIVAPWIWLQRPHEPIAQTAPGWGRDPPTAYGLSEGSVFVVIEPGVQTKFESSLRDNLFGFALNNKALLDEVLYGPGKQPWPAFHAGYLERVSIASIDPAKFAHTVVAEDPWAGREFAGHVLTETTKRFNLKAFEESFRDSRRERF